MTKCRPLRKIREIVNDALALLGGDFSRNYTAERRPSITPEKILSEVLAGAAGYGGRFCHLDVR